MPPPPGSSGPRGACRATAPRSHTRSLHRPHSLHHTPRPRTTDHDAAAHGAVRARLRPPRKNSERNAAAASNVRPTVREPGIHFLIEAGTHARIRRAVAPPGLQQCAPRLAHLDRCACNNRLSLLELEAIRCYYEAAVSEICRRVTTRITFSSKRLKGQGGRAVPGRHRSLAPSYPSIQPMTPFYEYLSKIRGVRVGSTFTLLTFDVLLPSKSSTMYFFYRMLNELVYYNNQFEMEEGILRAFPRVADIFSRHAQHIFSVTSVIRAESI